jgi:hypothetical protein
MLAAKSVVQVLYHAAAAGLSGIYLCLQISYSFSLYHFDVTLFDTKFRCDLI